MSNSAGTLTLENGAAPESADENLSSLEKAEHPKESSRETHTREEFEQMVDTLCSQLTRLFGPSTPYQPPIPWWRRWLGQRRPASQQYH